DGLTNASRPRDDKCLGYLGLYIDNYENEKFLKKTRRNLRMRGRNSAEADVGFQRKQGEKKQLSVENKICGKKKQETDPYSLVIQKNFTDPPKQKALHTKIDRR
ncbi:hypothetical protein ACJX0J_024296, partial [Zea mays]